MHLPWWPDIPISFNLPGVALSQGERHQVVVETLLPLYVYASKGSFSIACTHAVHRYKWYVRGSLISILAATKPFISIPPQGIVDRVHYMII